MSKKKQNVTTQKTGKYQSSSSSKKNEKQPQKKSKNNLILSFLSLVIIASAGLILYWGTTDYNLVYCDDNIFVIDYKPYNENPDNIFKSFEKSVGATYYRPLLSSSFVIDYQIGETNPEAYRVTNVVLHIIASCLVFLFLLILDYNIIGSFFFSMLFVVHPVITPAAAWLSGRNDSMITIFILLGFISLVGFRKIKSSWRWAIFPLHLTAFAASLFTKEIAVVFPALALFYIWSKDKKFINSQNLALVIGWLIVGLIWLAMRQNALKGIESPDTIGLDALIISYPTIAALLGKMFLPIKMAPLSTFEALSVISGIVVIFAFIFVTVWKKISWRRSIGFGTLWFSLFLVPTLLVRILYVSDFFDYAEHRAYLLLIGVIILCLDLLTTFKLDFRKPLSIIILTSIFIIFSVRSYAYRSVFENRTTFWQHFVDTYPYKARGYLDLGKAYYVKGDYDKAAELYKKGIERNPKNFNLYIDLTAVYLVKNDFRTAIYYGKKAVALDPKNPLANYNLGKSYLTLKMFKDAVPHLEIAVGNNNKFPAWFIDLGVAYYHTKQYDRAVNAYNKAILRLPNNPLGYANLGSALAQLRQYEKAEAAYRKAIQLNPRMFDAYNNLIQLYTVLGQKEKAQQMTELLRQNGGRYIDEVIQITSD